MHQEHILVRTTDATNYIYLSNNLIYSMHPLTVTLGVRPFLVALLLYGRYQSQQPNEGLKKTSALG